MTWYELYAKLVLWLETAIAAVLALMLLAPIILWPAPPQPPAVWITYGALEYA